MNQFQASIRIGQAFLCALALTCVASSASAGGGPPEAIGNAITYQGVLKQGGNPLNGTCDLQFSLWNALSAGTQIGTTQTFLAQNISGGRLTVAPDFGSGAFDGNDRWLQIAVRSPAGGGSYTPLTPRQKLSAVPYALFSVGGNTGFTLPYSASTSAASQTAFSISNTAAGSGGTSGTGNLFGVHGGHLGTGNFGQLGTGEYGVRGVGVDPADWGVFGLHNSTGNYGALGTGGEGVFALHSANGNYARLGTSSAAVHAVNAATTNYVLLAHPDYGVDGVVAGAEDTGVRGFHGPTGNYGRLGTDIFGADGKHQASGNFGFLGTAAAGAEGHHAATGSFARLATSQNGVFGRSRGPAGVEGAGVYGERADENGNSHVYGSLGVWDEVHGYMGLKVIGKAVFNGSTIVSGSRLTVDGGTLFTSPTALVSILRGGGGIQVDGDLVDFRTGISEIIQGTISVSGNTVSYNSFTGSHLGWTDGTIERGTLLRMTGANRRSHDAPNAEVIYGIAPSAIPNDPKCMGAYLDLQHATESPSNDNSHLIMAVGNGDMWVTQSSTGDIQPGDYLISSDVTGCAMKDDPQRFPVGYIVARAGEAVNWSTIDSPTDGSAKRKKISIFFENFVRDSRGAVQSESLSQTVRAQQARIALLEAELAALRAQFAERLAALEAAARH